MNGQDNIPEKLVLAEEEPLVLGEEEDSLLLADELAAGEETFVSSHQARKKGASLIPNFNAPTWKVMIVDDEREIHEVTQLALDDFNFCGKSLTFISAYSGKEARSLLFSHPDVALIFLDVVMESDDAGLRLVDFIRHELGNYHTRLIIRTGQPGIAPERYVIEHYDIDDYKDKTELTAGKLYSTLRTALKVFRDLTIIEANRQGLEKILSAAPDLYRIQPLRQFLEGILTQIASLCALGEDNLISSLSGIFAESTLKVSAPQVIRVGTGKFTSHSQNLVQVETTVQMCEEVLHGVRSAEILPGNSLLLPMKLCDEMLGFIYLENVGFLTEDDGYLLQIMVTQCAAALKNLRLYSDLERANYQNERKTRFLGMAAHDLRNPLGAIQGYLELLQEGGLGGFSREQLEYLDGIQTASRFMLNLVNNFLDVAKIEAGKLELERRSTNLARVVQKGLSFNRLLAETKHIQLEFIGSEDLPLVELDADKIQQVLHNLISNAIKYSYSHTHVQVAVTRGKDALILSVKDEGQGIPKHELNKLFQPFSKTSIVSTGGESSTGLGLLICRQIVEAHQGRIWVESQPGVGSVFYVELPIVTN